MGWHPNGGSLQGPSFSISHGPKHLIAALEISGWSKSYGEKVAAQNPDLSCIDGVLGVGLTDGASSGIGELGQGIWARCYQLIHQQERSSVRKWAGLGQKAPSPIMLSSASCCHCLPIFMWNLPIFNYWHLSFKNNFKKNHHVSKTKSVSGIPWTQFATSVSLRPPHRSFCSRLQCWKGSSVLPWELKPGGLLRRGSSQPVEMCGECCVYMLVTIWFVCLNVCVGQWTCLWWVGSSS